MQRSKKSTASKTRAMIGDVKHGQGLAGLFPLRQPELSESVMPII
jgi:hypothetical protein